MQIIGHPLHVPVSGNYPFIIDFETATCPACKHNQYHTTEENTYKAMASGVILAHQEYHTKAPVSGVSTREDYYGAHHQMKPTQTITNSVSKIENAFDTLNKAFVDNIFDRKKPTQKRVYVHSDLWNDRPNKKWWQFWRK